jgi:hypothetical protein
MIDLEAIKKHRALSEPDDCTSLPTICEHVDALIAEVERLRHEVADLQMLRDEHLIDNLHATEEGRNEERAAVVEWLRAESRVVLGDAKRLLAWASTQVERGEHRRQETE